MRSINENRTARHWPLLTVALVTGLSACAHAPGPSMRASAAGTTADRDRQIE